MKAIKITNTLWLNTIADKIDEFTRKTKVPGIFPQTLATYFHNTIQFGGDKAEFWVVFDDEKNPVAFSHWFVRGLPHISKTYIDFIYSWIDDREAVMLLVEQLENFTLRNRATIIEGDTINKKLLNHFKTIALKFGWEAKESGIVNFTAKKTGKPKEVKKDESNNKDGN